MKFHLIAVSLLSVMCAIMYYIIAGVQSDFDDAHATIRKEAIQTVKKKRTEELRPIQSTPETPSKPKLDEKKFLNPAVYQPAPTQVAESSSLPAPTGIMIERIGNDEYWCRDTVEPRKELNPVKCYYSAACYGCVGSTVIPPDSESVVPVCDNGRQAEIFSIECCPESADGGQLQCPSARQCLHAEAVPSNYCSCNNRPECKYVAIGGQVECVCIQ